MDWYLSTSLTTWKTGTMYQSSFWKTGTWYRVFRKETHNRVLPKQERTLLWVLSLMEQTFLRFSAYAKNRRMLCRDVREKSPSGQDDRLPKHPERLRQTQAASAAYWDRLLQVACPIIILGSYAQYNCPGTNTAIPGHQ